MVSKVGSAGVECSSRDVKKKKKKKVKVILLYLYKLKDET